MIATIVSALLLPAHVHAGELSAGWSTLNDPLVSGILLGGEAAVGYRQHLSGPLSVEGRFSYSPDTGESRISELTSTLVQIAHQGSESVDFQQPVVVNTWRLELLVDLGPQRDPDRLQGVPHLRGGFGIEGQSSYTVRYDDTAEGDVPIELLSTDSGIGVPLITEFSQDLWGARGFGIRFSAGLLTELRSKPQYDPDEPVNETELYFRPRIGLDLLLDVGGA